MFRRFGRAVAFVIGVLSLASFATYVAAEEAQFMASQGNGAELVFEGHEDRKDLAGTCYFIDAVDRNAVIAIFNLHDAPGAVAFRGARIELRERANYKAIVKQIAINGVVDKDVPAILWLDRRDEFCARLFSAQSQPDMGVNLQHDQPSVTIFLKNVVIK